MWSVKLKPHYGPQWSAAAHRPQPTVTQAEVGFEAPCTLTVIPAAMYLNGAA